MIRYSISDTDLQAQIDAAKPGWSAAAAARTQRLIGVKRYIDDWDEDEQRVAWSDIKPVYRKLQGDKCGYCERPLATSGSKTPDIGASEHDIEHYRPKAEVTAWGPRKHAPAPQFGFAWVNEARSGY